MLEVLYWAVFFIELLDSICRVVVALGMMAGG